MRKLLSLLLAACLLAAPIRAFAVDVTVLDDTPPMEEDAGGGEEERTPSTSAAGAGDKDKTTATHASGSGSPRTGDEHSPALWTGALLLAAVGLTVTSAVGKRERESV